MVEYESDGEKSKKPRKMPYNVGVRPATSAPSDRAGEWLGLT